MSANDPKKPADPKAPTPPPGEPQKGDSLSEFDLSYEGQVEFGELPPSEEASRVALAQLPEPPSGQSLTTWTEVIRRQRASQESKDEPGGTEPVRVDAPSDKDLLTRLSEAEAREAPSGAGGGQPGSTSRILGAPQFGPGGRADVQQGSDVDLGRIGKPVFGPGGRADVQEGSDVDLGRALPARQVGGSDVRFDILYPPSDAGGALPLPTSLPPLSNSVFDQAVAVPVPAGAYPPDTPIPYALPVGTAGSGVDLVGDEELHGDPVQSSILDVLLSESRFESPPAVPPPVKGMRPTMPTAAAAGPAHAIPTQPGIDVPERREDPFDLGGSVPGEDLVDLSAGNNRPPSLTDSGTLEISDKLIEEAVRRKHAPPVVESSAVDLAEPAGRESAYDAQLSDNPPRRVSDANIDLALPPLEMEASAAQQLPPALPDSADRTSPRKPKKAARSRPEVAPARLEPVAARGAGRRNLVLGTALGLVLGAGGVLAAYFGGALPGREDGSGTNTTTTSGAGTGDVDEVTRARQDADTARAAAAATKANYDQFNATVQKALTAARVPNADRPAEAIQALASRNQQLTAEANKNRDAVALARQDAEAARKALTDAQKTADEARRNLAEAQKAAADASKAADTARVELAAAMKATDDKVADARKAAEAKEKEALAKVAELTRREEDYAKAVDTAKKAAEDAAKARDSIQTTLQAIGDRLAKAKLVGGNPDAAALVKGVDDALKAVSTDATASLREELVKARDQEAKLKADLTAAREKEAAAEKSATALKAEAQKLQDQARAAEQKLAAETERLSKELIAARDQAATAAKTGGDMTKLKAENERLAKETAAAVARAQEAAKTAEAAKAEADRVAADTTRLKTENDRLARDLEAVRELSELLKSPAVTTAGPGTRPDPAKLADRFFGDGVRAYYAGRHTDAESALRKAIQFNAEDARYHYLLGLTLWMRKDVPGAEAEFEKGRDLELAGRPSSRAISAMLERIQGPARQAVNAYRP